MPWLVVESGVPRRADLTPRAASSPTSEDNKFTPYTLNLSKI